VKLEIAGSSKHAAHLVTDLKLFNALSTANPLLPKEILNGDFTAP
jgi:hypothetical protein